MDLVFPIAIALALAGVLVVLGMGILNLLGAHKSGGAQELDRARRSNKLMQWRVILQGAALAIMFLGFLIAAKG